MKFIDLFAGIGGFRSGLELNGHECIGFSEFDQHATNSYKAIHDTENEIEFGDITQVTDEQFDSLKDEVDIVCGGSPCQSFSYAGSRKGFEDTRGTLFFQYARAIQHTQPKMFIFENVLGLLSHDNQHTIKTILSTFDELGYYIDFNIYNSKYHGVPQSRDRIYITGVRKDLVNEPPRYDKIKRPGRHGMIKNWAMDNIHLRKFMPKPLSDYTAKVLDVLEPIENIEEKHFISDLLKSRAYSRPHWLTHLINYQEDWFNNDYTRVKNSMHGLIPVTNVSPSEYRAYNVYSVMGVVPTITTRMTTLIALPLPITDDNRHDIAEQFIIRRPSIKEVFRMQGFTDDQYERAMTSGTPMSQIYKQLGNAVTVNVVDYVVKGIEEWYNQNKA